MLSLEDRILLVKLYFKNGESLEQTIRSYGTAHQIKDKAHLPDRHTISSLISKFEEFGTVHDLPRTGRKKDDKLREIVAIKSAETLLCSSSSIATSGGISQSSAWRILRNEFNLYPYKIVVGQVLTLRSKEERLAFCKQFLSNFKADETILNNIWWSDEITFPVHAIPNRQNCRFWTEQKCDVPIIEMPTFSRSITVFAAFNNRHILQPYFFEENGSPVTVNGERYREMIQQHLVPQLKQKRCFSKAVFQQDGAPPHTAAETKILLSSIFSDNRVISKAFPMAWPAYSPDMTPCDFWLWNYVKTQVYADPQPTNLIDLKAKIKLVFKNIDVNILPSVIFDIIKRMTVCVNVNGAHLEHVLHS
jgi:hypothetical protein